METPVRLWSQHLANLARAAFWLLLAVIVLLQLTGSRGIERQRAAALGQFERERSSRVIAMIHRQEGASLLGVPVAGSISIDDSEAVLRAIRLTPPEQPIDVILHTPGGLVLAAEQIAKALVEHKGKVTVFVPHYAMSGGTLIALAADEIVMDANAVLGPVDPQLGTAQSSFAAASVMKALSQPNPNREDTTLMLGDLAEKALRQVHATVRKLLAEHHSEADAERIASALADGQWTHDYPLDVEALTKLGLTVGTELPRSVYDLMDLYPQTSQRRPGVEFIPIPYPQRNTEPPHKAER